MKRKKGYIYIYTYLQKRRLLVVGEAKREEGVELTSTPGNPNGELLGKERGAGDERIAMSGFVPKFHHVTQAHHDICVYNIYTHKDHNSISDPNFDTLELITSESSGQPERRGLVLDFN